MMQKRSARTVTFITVFISFADSCSFGFGQSQLQDRTGTPVYDNNTFPPVLASPLLLKNNLLLLFVIIITCTGRSILCLFISFNKVCVCGGGGGGGG